ncbi:MAG TPA: hypothetical protein V6C99_11270 [Oculatellaceae cyanobacterium]|jgi:hypothetical protein
MHRSNDVIRWSPPHFGAPPSNDTPAQAASNVSQPPDGNMPSNQKPNNLLEQLKQKLFRKQEIPATAASIPPTITSTPPLEIPEVFKVFTNPPATTPEARAFGKPKPPFSITPDEIRVSKAAEKQAAIDQEVVSQPWDLNRLFIPDNNMDERK